MYALYVRLLVNVGMNNIYKITPEMLNYSIEYILSSIYFYCQIKGVKVRDLLLVASFFFSQTRLSSFSAVYFPTHRKC